MSTAPTAPVTSRFAEELQACVLRGTFEAPRLPHLAGEILNLVSQDASMSDIGVLLARDPGLTAQVLHLANSAFLGGREPISRLSQAMARIGLRSLKQLISAYAIKGRVFESDVFADDMQAAWQHAVGCAVAADLVAKAQGMRDERVFVAGLLHDIGRPVALHVASDLIAGDPSLGETAREEVLERVYHVHTVLGRIMASRWGLPDCYRDVMSHHHDPDYDGEHVELVSLVAVGDALCRQHGIGYPATPEAYPCHRPQAQVLGLDRKKLEGIGAALLERSATFLG